ncbi:ribonuclease H-like protein [Brevundimonas phage vB_BpoS-MaInes]|nr:ribonuclease H-like protein [Brevundimonas phage vB_BpoS-MaInes]
MLNGYTTKTANPLFWAMLKAAHRKGEGSPLMLDRTIIGIDPGETTGFGFRKYMDAERFELHMKQIPTKDRYQGALAIRREISAIRQSGGINPLVVCEDYRVYGHKTEQHAWAGLHTPKLIGAIEFFCAEMDIPMVFPMAIEGKSWATDDMLKQWGLYDPGMKHARDASRHIVTRTFFGKDTG